MSEPTAPTSSGNGRLPEQRRAAEPTVLAIVGTDVHPFDRMLHWVGEWSQTRRSSRLVIQHGYSGAPAVPGAVRFLDHGALQAAMAAATVVVCHGGPATISEARRHGHRPVVVARDPEFGEHVDDHQLRFAGRLAQAGLVVHCRSAAELAAALSAGIDRPMHHRGPGSSPPPPGVVRVGAIVDSLIERRNQ